MPRPTRAQPVRRSPGSEAWRRASEHGTLSLDALEHAHGTLRPRVARALAVFCARRRLLESFAWAARRMAEPGRASARAAWRMASDMAEALITRPQAGSFDALCTTGQVLLTVFGPPPVALLFTRASRGDFGALSSLLSWTPMDARLAQRLVDARPALASSLHRPVFGLRASTWGPRVDAAFRAGAFLAPHAPHVDLARDARTLDPSCCAFALGAGARAALASSPPLATLCHEAALRHATTSKGWPLLSTINTLQAGLGLPPEAFCARLLLDAGCAPSDCLPGGSSALSACTHALRASTRVRGSERSRARLARILPLARWIAGPTSSLPARDTPLGALEALLRAASERTAFEHLSADAELRRSNRL